MLCLVGSVFTYNKVALHIKASWKPCCTFRLRRVQHQSFIAGFHEKEDFEVISSLKLYWFDNTIAVICLWSPGIDTTKGTMDTTPHRAAIVGIPHHMWTDEAIGRISNTLGSPISARVISARSKNEPLLETCVAITHHATLPLVIRV